MFSCKNFDGKISTHDNLSLLTNISQNQKLKFTVKTTIEHENGTIRSIVSFKELEPGEEVMLGKNIIFKGDKFYNKQLFDTIKEYKHYDKIPKETKSDTKILKELAIFENKKYPHAKYYVTNYTKNNIKYNPYKDNDGGINLFWSTSDLKKIDSTEDHQTQIITYLAPSEFIPDQTKPKKQEKIIYTYEIKGQRVLN
ncbi:hypothetical protein EON71_01365 [bacterium]|nr:MAG: hypothetical protein EON71_01365 [bacterium]